MTAQDPQLALQGDLPWHFGRRADDTEDDGADYRAIDEPDDEGEDQADYSFADAVADEEAGVNLLAIAVVAAALVVGIGVGAGGTALLMSSHHARRPPAVVASAAPRPARLAATPIAPPPVEAVASAPPGELGPRAVARAPAAKSVAPRAHRSAAEPTAAPTQLATACDTSGGQRQTLICAWPAIAAADREMRRAYQHALDAGVDRGSLQASQARWSTTSEFAARRSAADLATAYHRRIGELNTLAANEPPR